MHPYYHRSTTPHIPLLANIIIELVTPSNNTLAPMSATSYLFNYYLFVYNYVYHFILLLFCLFLFTNFVVFVVVVGNMSFQATVQDPQAGQRSAGCSAYIDLPYISFCKYFVCPLLPQLMLIFFSFLFLFF